MRPRRLETADVFRSREKDFVERHPLSSQQRKVFRDIVACRTAALGGWVRRCDRCDHQEISYRSCRNRHCPKCQGTNRAKWLEAKADDLLPVPYHHVVFTLPAALGPIALQNQRVVYGILFRAVSETLRTIAGDRKHLGARIGFLAVLHTWGQNLMHHPHLHCVAPGGGLSPDGSRWVPCRRGFFLPVRVLSRFFRRRFLTLLDAERRKGGLAFHGVLEHLRDPAKWRALLSGLRRHDWVVHSKPPFGGPEQVLKYFSRYTHRVAISNRRLLSFDGRRARFRWKDYRKGGQPRVMTLEADEFIRRFLLHVVPKGFVRIRGYGFLANRNRKDKLEGCRRLIGCPPPAGPEATTTGPATPEATPVCPSCGLGRLLPPEPLPPATPKVQERSRDP